MFQVQPDVALLVCLPEVPEANLHMADALGDAIALNEFDYHEISNENDRLRVMASKAQVLHRVVDPLRDLRRSDEANEFGFE
jgi:hypothetical protein